MALSEFAGRFPGQLLHYTRALDRVNDPWSASRVAVPVARSRTRLGAAPFGATGPKVARTSGCQEGGSDVRFSPYLLGFRA